MNQITGVNDDVRKRYCSRRSQLFFLLLFGAINDHGTVYNFIVRQKTYDSGILRQQVIFSVLFRQLLSYFEILKAHLNISGLTELIKCTAVSLLGILKAGSTPKH